MVGVYVLKKDSADGRLLIWKISVLAMSDWPVLGVGLDHFCGTYGNTQAACFSYPLSVLPLVVVLVMLLALSTCVLGNSIGRAYSLSALAFYLRFPIYPKGRNGGRLILPGGKNKTILI